MERHVHVIAGDGKRLATYPVTLGVEKAELRDAEYFERARHLAREDKLVENEAQAQALRFEFATGPR